MARPELSMTPGVPVHGAEMRRASLIAAGMLLVCCAGAFAQNPALDVSQYAHKAWRVSEGFAKGVMRSIAQTPDGYLWVGTDFGLLRFDGVRAVAWQPAPGEHLPGTDVRRLLAARDGRLWIGASRGLASWKDGKLTRYPELEGQTVQALLEDREGAVWVGGWKPSLGKLCTFQNDHTQCYGEDGRFGNGVTALHEDRDGNLWAGGITGLWRLRPGPPTRYTLKDPAEEVFALSEGDDGGILVARRSGLTQLKEGRARPYPLPAGLPFAPNRLLRDRYGGLWIGAMVDMGLLHIHDGRTDRFTPDDGLSGGAVSSLLEDREGNIWVSTLDGGVDRFRAYAIPTMSVRQGLSSRGVYSILAASDGSMWLGTSDGLNKWNNGRITIYRKRGLRGGRGGSLLSAPTAAWDRDSRATVREIADHGLPENTVVALHEDARGQIWVGSLNGVAIYRAERFFLLESVPHGIVSSITGDRKGSIWISHQEALFHLFQERVVERIPWARLGRRESASVLLHDATRGGVWLGFRDGGVAHLTNGRIGASYGEAEGLTPGMVRGLYIDGKRALWAATVGGLNRIQDGSVVTLTGRNGLPCDMVHWMMEDDADSVWLYLACGLVRISRADFDAWAVDPTRQIRTTVFDSADGVRHLGVEFGYSSVVAKADGKIWFLPFGGVSIIDPQHLAGNPRPPPVHIERIIADHETYEAAPGLRLPPLVRDLQIDYTALSFAAPERNRFRVMLEGRDRDWRDLGARREAFYTDLGPGTYRFRVVASNNSGVWNETGATLEFSIDAAYYQTRWFQAAIAGGVFALLWVGYALRIRQVARQFTRTMDARVGERARIARELHDTLLQSFHGLLLRFQTALYLLPDRPAEAKETLAGAIDRAAQAITEGRDAVQGLRSSTLEQNDLAEAISALGAELAADGSGLRPAVHVAVEGETRELHPILRDEIYKIAAEALRNAFRHAHAGRVEVEIRYDTEQFRLRVRDDGKGIDPAVLAKQGLEGHYGLRGMPERAALIGGKLAVWSEVGAGTEVELRLPARLAYATSRRRSWWARLLSSGPPSG
jgi:signal transduction histidine kinase/ligand-binding sensor domain-containing protein